MFSRLAARLPSTARCFALPFSSKAPNAPPGIDDRLAVLFPRLGRTQASIEVKKRVLKFSPGMGGKRLKLMTRQHARRGTMNSFVADLESRLDRFLWRLNLVPSIFTARQLCGHGHVMVNGRVERSTHRTLKPYDLVEPAPKSRQLFKLQMKKRRAAIQLPMPRRPRRVLLPRSPTHPNIRRRRLDNNTFYLSDQMPDALTRPQDATAAQRPSARSGEASAACVPSLHARAIAAPHQPTRRPPPTTVTLARRRRYDLAQLRAGGAESGRTARQRLPPALDEASAGSAAVALQPAVLSAVLAMCRGQPALHEQLLARREQLVVRAPPSPSRAAVPPPPVSLCWEPGGGALPVPLMRLDRVRLRRLLLAMLALQPAA